ncbi:hypothetical protein [Dactylosporangium sp. CA-233914]|uniref:hypothetical protein n=1 Tax=Dactylosporangium sp. CA-233914 TaxID=3239934 RepID=UPI003D9248DF
MSDRRLRVAAAAAVVAAGALLLLPSPPAVTAPGPGGGGEVLNAPTIDLPATLPDGTTFTPAAVLDPHSVVVQIADADPATATLALLDPADPASPRPLERIPIAGGGSFDAVRVDGAAVYWMSSVADDQGFARSTLHRADASGRVVTLTTDTGHATFTGGMHDLEIADGRVWWTATRGTTVPTTDLRSIPVGGGAVTVRPLEGTYHLTGWPWATDDGIAGQPVVQLDLVSGQRRTFAEPPGQDVYCGALWCRSVVTTQQSAVVTLRRADGTGQTGRINTDGEVSLFLDIAVLDRFEFLAAPISTQAATMSERLTMYDLRAGRRIGLAVATSEGLSGSWVWWATGDNETMTWHLLDLSAVP